MAYDFWVDPRDRGRIRVFEEWASAEANAAHAASEHLAAFYAGLADVRVPERRAHPVRGLVPGATLSAPGRVLPAVPAPIARTVGDGGRRGHRAGAAPRRARRPGVPWPGRGRAAPSSRSRPTPDPGWFGPDSMTWRIHADRSMLIGGLRALYLQVLHPLAMAGVADHSSYREDPLGRLARTGRFVAATTYGTRGRGRARGRRWCAPSTIACAASRPTAARTTPTIRRCSRGCTTSRSTRSSPRTAATARGPLADADADRYVAEMAVVGRRARRRGRPGDRGRAHGVDRRRARPRHDRRGPRRDPVPRPAEPAAADAAHVRGDRGGRRRSAAVPSPASRSGCGRCRSPIRSWCGRRRRRCSRCSVGRSGHPPLPANAR